MTNYDDDDEAQAGIHLPWADGLPTKPDVDALLKAYPPDGIEPGEWQATDDAMHAVLGSNCVGNRYKTVCDAWRRRLLRDHSVTIYRNKNRGFYCPTAAEVYAQTHPTLSSCNTKLTKQLRHVTVSKPTNETESATREHQGRLLYVQRREIRKSRMNVLPSSSVKEQPKIQPPSKSGAQP